MNGYSCLFLKCCGFLRQAQRMALCTVWMLALISRCLLWRLTRKRYQVSWAWIVFVSSGKADWKMSSTDMTEVVVNPSLTKQKKWLRVVITSSWTVKQSVLRSHCKWRTSKTVNFSQQILWRINLSKQICSFGIQSLCLSGEEGLTLWNQVENCNVCLLHP